MAYRFEVDRPNRHPAAYSHQGAKRYAWNWAKGLVEGRVTAKLQVCSAASGGLARRY